jgi:2-polyprenyl-3-methyl-5-hydroxy-6-metoxy-1,4-benzoquinol methylase
VNSCPLCTEKAVRRLKLPHTEIWRCRSNSCRLEFASPQLDERELARLYRTLYYPATDDNVSAECKATSDSVLRQVLPQLEVSLGSLQSLRLLDYGCGRGPLLRIASDFGLSPVGIEPDPVARSFAAKQIGMPVYSNLADMCSKHPKTEFDLVVLWNVIEHLRQPWSELQEIRRVLSPTGRLLLCTMNTGCLRARIERGRWPIYEHPTHLFYFDRRSLEGVLRRAGFRIVQEWKPEIHYPHHGFFRRYFYWVSNSLGISDGLYYLCSTLGDDT